MNKLDYLCHEGRAILLKYLPRNSCVSGTRFALEILNDEESCEQPVYLVVIGPNTLSVVGRPPFQTSALWQGHLVAIIDNYLLDISLDQIDGLYASYFELSPGFSEGVPMVVNQGENTLIYWADDNNFNYRNYDSWKKNWKEPYLNFLSLHDRLNLGEVHESDIN